VTCPVSLGHIRCQLALTVPLRRTIEVMVPLPCRVSYRQAVIGDPSGRSGVGEPPLHGVSAGLTGVLP